MRTRLIVCFVLTALAASGLLLQTAAAHDVSPARYMSVGDPGPDFVGQMPALSPAGLAELSRAAQASAIFYRGGVAAALAAGYVPASPCEPAMGFHWINPLLMSDTAVAAERPEILLFAPAGDGTLRLVGLEYWVADADQNLTTSPDRPSLFGVGFDGPMLGHAPGMPIHYDLHYYAWVANPSPTLTMFNPNVVC